VRTDTAGPKPTHLQDLPDGSWLAHLRQTHSAAARRAEPMLVRVIDYTIDDGRGNPAAYRLLTTLTDPDEATATDLAAAYTQRWEIELAFDELKTHQRGPRTVLRSKSPDLVLQEIWGHLCCHFAVRSLMTEAAGRSGHDPDRVSFVAALRITRQSIAHQGDFPPLTTLTPANAAGRRSCAGSSTGSTPPDEHAPTPASSNASTSNGTSNAPATANGPPRTRTTPSSALTERY
jgi:hypothetical protein